MNLLKRNDDWFEDEFFGSGFNRMEDFMNSMPKGGGYSKSVETSTIIK